MTIQLNGCLCAEVCRMWLSQLVWKALPIIKEKWRRCQPNLAKSNAGMATRKELLQRQHASSSEHIGRLFLPITAWNQLTFLPTLPMTKLNLPGLVKRLSERSI